MSLPRPYWNADTALFRVALSISIAWVVCIGGYGLASGKLMSTISETLEADYILACMARV